MRNPGQTRKKYKTLTITPYDVRVYGTKADRRGIYKVNSGSAMEGVITFTDPDLVGRGVTGMLYALGEPTGYYDDRWSQLYSVPVTGVLEYSGATGSNGCAEVDFQLDVSGITGVAHGDLYGVSFQVNETGPHINADVIIRVDDTMG